MNIWQILGIDPTADKAAITAAYRSKLAGANPEDNPEAFKELRSAYEQALSLAKQTAKADSAAFDSADGWIAQVDQVYHDVRRRRDPAEWAQLLALEYPSQPANKTQARDNLMEYLTNHCFLPHKVWVILDQAFELQNHAQELMEAFPPPFIQNMVLPGIEREEQISYDYIECQEGQNCDQFIRFLTLSFQALSDRQNDQAKNLLAQAKATGVSHPYTHLVEGRLALLENRAEDAQRELDVLLAQLPEDLLVRLLDAQVTMHRQDYPQAREKLEEILFQYPDHAQARFDLADCLDHLGQKLEAKKVYLDLIRKSPFNQTILGAMNQLNQELLPLLQEKYQENPQDYDNLIELIWCHHQLHQLDKANHLLDTIPESYSGKPDYENLASKVKIACGHWDAALRHLLNWEKVLTEQDPDNQEKLAECRRIQACAHYYKGEKEECYRILDEVAQTWPQFAETRKLQAQFHLSDEELDKALEAASLYCKQESEDPLGPYLCGQILFHLGRLQESYNAFTQSMNVIRGRDAMCLFYQCRILMRVGQWDDAKDLLDQLIKAGITGVTMDFCRGMVDEHEGRKINAAEHYQLAVQSYRREDPPDFMGEVIFRLVRLEYNTRDKSELLSLVEEGLGIDTRSVSLLDLKGDLLHDLNEMDAAIRARRQLCKLDPSHPTAFESLGRLLQFCKQDFAGAVDAYREQLKVRQTAPLYNLLGLCLQELERFPEAEAEFLHAVELAPEVPAYMANLAELYLIWKEYPKSEEAYKKALSLPLPCSQERVRLRQRYSLLLRRMGRWEEAAQALAPNIYQEFYSDDCRTQAELWAQAGNPERAMACLKEWKKRVIPPEENFLREKAALLYQMGKVKAAQKALERGARVSRRCCYYLGDLYAAQGRYREALALFRRLSKDHPGEDDYLSREAKCLWLIGDIQGAAQTAREGLAALEKNRSRYNKALYYTRKATLHIFAGQYDLAREALENAESAPFCSFCTYPACKDALSTRALLLEVTGQLGQALELCRQAQGQYPDEPDFTDYAKRIEKKMREKL